MPRQLPLVRRTRKDPAHESMSGRTEEEGRYLVAVQQVAGVVVWKAAVRMAVVEEGRAVTAGAQQAVKH